MNEQASEQCLKDAIRLLLETSQQNFSEYELICYLNEQGWTLSLDASDPTVLFKTHFLVYHALYELQEQYWASEQRLLEISALVIGFIENHSQNESSTGKSALTSDEKLPTYENHQALRDYYLDLSHLEKATDESVNELLKQFWSRFVASDEKAEALTVLDLPSTTDLKTLKHRYRALAMEHHPDRGGEAEQFQRINWAFGVLQKALT